MNKDWKVTIDTDDPFINTPYIDAKAGTPVQEILACMMEEDLVAFGGQYHSVRSDGQIDLTDHWVSYVVDSPAGEYFLNLLKLSEEDE